jgi:hypothetical protein
MLAGRTGLALFPAKLDDPEVDPESSNVRLHHFLSVYLQDPDGHRVELTTLDSRPGDFYAS